MPLVHEWQHSQADVPHMTYEQAMKRARFFSEWVCRVGGPRITYDASVPRVGTEFFLEADNGTRMDYHPTEADKDAVDWHVVPK